MEIRNMREIRNMVDEIRNIMSQKRAETVSRRLIVLKTENMNPFLKRDIDYLIKVINDPDTEYRNMVCDIVENTLNNIKRGRY